MRILITSDNHLGYRENDVVLCNDSYVAFEEILVKAREKKVDLILQGGDLFHENRPSRDCLNRTIMLLRRYCVGDEKSSLISSPPINSSDENIRITMPVVAIHGNHDDPSGERMTSALDILQSSGLVSYVGKCEHAERVDVHPLLLEHGHRIALYCLGHVRERRLWRLFAEGAVVFHKPKDHERWLNILVVHQNRAPREREYFRDCFVNDFFDLVVFGHEHGSCVVKGRFLGLQPGSTVRTSLCDGERGDKYVYVLDVGDEVVLEHVKLETVRPFVLGNIKVLDGEDADGRIWGRIEGMLDGIEEEQKKEEICRTVLDVDGRRFRCEGEVQRIERTPVDERTLFEITERLPLLRLRVEVGRDVVVNRYGFGARLKGRVANPNEVLSITRRHRKEKDESVGDAYGRRVEIFTVLASILSGIEFNVLRREEFTESLDEFVCRGNKEAFGEMVKRAVQRVVDDVDYGLLAGGDIEKIIKDLNHRLEQKENINHTSVISIHPSHQYEHQDLPSDSVSWESFPIHPRPVDDPLFETLTPDHIPPTTQSPEHPLITASIPSYDTYPSTPGRATQRPQSPIPGYLQPLVEAGRAGKRRKEEDTSTDASFTFSKYL